MKKEKIFWGILFVLAAIFLVVAKLGFMQDMNVFTLFFTIVCVAIIMKSIFEISFGGMLFPLAFLAIIYDEQLGIETLTPWTVLLVALLGTIGLNMIFGKMKRKHKYSAYMGKNDDPFEAGDYETIDVEDDSHIKIETKFGAIAKYVNSDHFVQADVNCSFCGAKIYFDNAILENNKGVVRLDVSFAGVELYIPRDWKVENHAHASFGAIDEKVKNTPNSENVLSLVGNVSFGAVEIIYI